MQRRWPQRLNVWAAATILASCRRHDFERQLQRASRRFNLILELEPWQADNINAFVAALRKAGKTAAAEFIERHANNGLAPSFISLPLWLNMLAFLADRPGMQQQQLQRTASQDDYDLLRLCVDAVAEDELFRHAVKENGTSLQHQWSLAAWELHQAWRERRNLLLGDLAGRLGLDFDSPLGKAVLSFLDTQRIENHRVRPPSLSGSIGWLNTWLTALPIRTWIAKNWPQGSRTSDR